MIWWLRLPIGHFLWPVHKIPVVASLTSYPPRIKNAWIAIETLLRQTALPERLVLVLNTEDFPTKKLPRKIQSQTRRGLEILWIENDGKSFDKLLPVRTVFPDMSVVTFDDDKFFPRGLLEAIYGASIEFPNHVVGARGWLIQSNDSNTQLHFGDGYRSRIKVQTRGSNLFLPGGNGCLYPPNSLHPSVDDLESALSICSLSDDIWFWCAIQKNQTPMVCLGMDAHRPILAMKGGPALSDIDKEEQERQFQAAVHYFGIRDHLLKVTLKASKNG